MLNKKEAKLEIKETTTRFLKQIKTFPLFFNFTQKKKATENKVIPEHKNIENSILFIIFT